MELKTFSLSLHYPTERILTEKGRVEKAYIPSINEREVNEFRYIMALKGEYKAKLRPLVFPTSNPS